MITPRNFSLALITLVAGGTETGAALSMCGFLVLYYKCTKKFLLFMQVILRKILFLPPGPLRSCCDLIIFLGYRFHDRGHLNRFALIQVPAEHRPVVSFHSQSSDSSSERRLLQNSTARHHRAMLTFPQISLIRPICTSAYILSAPFKLQIAHPQTHLLLKKNITYKIQRVCSDKVLILSRKKTLSLRFGEQTIALIIKSKSYAKRKKGIKSAIFSVGIRPQSLLTNLKL